MFWNVSFFCIWAQTLWWAAVVDTVFPKSWMYRERIAQWRQERLYVRSTLSVINLCNVTERGVPQHELWHFTLKKMLFTCVFSDVWNVEIPSWCKIQDYQCLLEIESSRYLWQEGFHSNYKTRAGQGREILAFKTLMFTSNFWEKHPSCTTWINAVQRWCSTVYRVNSQMRQWGTILPIMNMFKSPCGESGICHKMNVDEVPTRAAKVLGTAVPRIT